MFPSLVPPGRPGRGRRLVSVAVICAVPMSIVTVACAGTPRASAEQAESVGAMQHPAADGNGWAMDDTITARVSDGIPRTADARCTWNVVTGVDPVAGTTERPVTRVVAGVKETLYQRSCPDNRDSWYQWIKETTKARLVDHVSSTVTDRLKALVFRTAPARDRVVVNVGTWFWVPRTLWKPVSVTAYVTTPVGVVSVTLTATPSRLRFDPGNNDAAVWCDGPGDAWTTADGDAAASDCMYTYRHASDARPDRRFVAHTAVEWNLRMKSNFGLAFPLPHARTTLTTPVVVRELQAVLAP